MYLWRGGPVNTYRFWVCVLFYVQLIRAVTNTNISRTFTAEIGRKHFNQQSTSYLLCFVGTENCWSCRNTGIHYRFSDESTYQQATQMWLFEEYWGKIFEFITRYPSCNKLLRFYKKKTFPRKFQKCSLLTYFFNITEL